VLAASARIEPGMLEPYAIVTARNVIASMWREAIDVPFARDQGWFRII
jgi:hypothetical protein